MKKKNMRRISVLVTAQTAHNLGRLADMDGGNEGRVIDKLVRDRMILLHEAERLVKKRSIKSSMRIRRGHLERTLERENNDLLRSTIKR